MRLPEHAADRATFLVHLFKQKLTIEGGPIDPTGDLQYIVKQYVFVGV